MATLVAMLTIPAKLAAQEQQAKNHPARYTVTDPGTLRGTFGVAEGITSHASPSSSGAVV